jgi:CheY-like chemotaxis protein
MMRVLVVDDDRDTTETMCFLLMAWGHETHTAHDGTAAIEAAEQFRPDVMLLDLALGSQPSGYEVARHVRQQPGKQIVIICVSGYGQDEDRRRSREAGCDHHLLKPVDLEGLHSLLDSIRASSPS